MKIEDIPPPSIDDFKKASGISKLAAKDWLRYSIDCRRRANLILQKSACFFKGDFERIRILDWGSAAGGVAIVLKELLPYAQMYAADLDSHSISWLSKNIPNIFASELHVLKPLPFPNFMFNIVYGISVFTHISAQDHEFYINELSRIIAVDGLLIITVHCYKACEFNKVSKKDPAFHPHHSDELKKAGIIYKSYSESVLSEIDFVGGGDYGVTYHSHDYLVDKFDKYFQVLEIVEGGLGSQDLIVMKKK